MAEDESGIVLTWIERSSLASINLIRIGNCSYWQLFVPVTFLPSIRIYSFSVLPGFSREVSAEEFAQRIENKTLLEVLNKVEVQKGDVLFIEPGTIHAIGAGNVIAEVQQNSNVSST